MIKNVERNYISENVVVTEIMLHVKRGNQSDNCLLGLTQEGPHMRVKVVLKYWPTRCRC